MASRKPRQGELTCNCNAYRFPHRFGGGRCTGAEVVYQQWASSYGTDAVCSGCHCFNNSGEYPYCEVDAGQEGVESCPVWQDFVQQHEIRIYK